MRFIETPNFTQAVLELLEDDEYRTFQASLLMRPELGKVISGTGGLRKVRWSRQGQGKRGGCRVIYYWDGPSETFYLLYVYSKSDREDLTKQQLQVLGRVVREEFG